MVQWGIESIPPGGPVELFFIPSSAPQLVCGSYRRCFAANRKRVPHEVSSLIISVVFKHMSDAITIK